MELKVTSMTSRPQRVLELGNCRTNLLTLSTVKPIPASTGKNPKMAWTCGGLTNKELVSNLVKNKIIASKAVEEASREMHSCVAIISGCTGYEQSGSRELRA